MLIINNILQYWVKTLIYMLGIMGMLILIGCIGDDPPLSSCFVQTDVSGRGPRLPYGDGEFIWTIDDQNIIFRGNDEKLYIVNIADSKPPQRFAYTQGIWLDSVTNNNQFVFTSFINGKNQPFIGDVSSQTISSIEFSSHVNKALFSPVNKTLFVSLRDGRMFPYAVVDLESDSVNIHQVMDVSFSPVSWMSDGQGLVGYNLQSSSEDLYYLDINTDELTQLTSPPYCVHDAIVSPVNNQIVFRSGHDKNWDLFLLDENGDTNSLTRTQSDEREPVWSPDGQQIAFIRFERITKEKIRQDIYILDIDSGEERALVQTSDMLEAAPRWSPDGKYIAFLSIEDEKQEWTLNIVSVDDGIVQQVAILNNDPPVR
ncbi:MAG TPA: hypothetical protein VLL52_22060 [Anaerolineae bacterium]|nr:hypothetical protein [Anaerolineae bacterium]